MWPWSGVLSQHSKDIHSATWAEEAGRDHSLGMKSLHGTQVLVGEFVLYKPLHANITNAVTTTLHFIIDALAAFIVAILVQIVRRPPLAVLLSFLPTPRHCCCTILMHLLDSQHITYMLHMTVALSGGSDGAVNGGNADFWLLPLGA